jgi:hypothetical protein
MQHLNHLTELVLDEWAAQELGSREREQVAEHLARCEHCRGRHEALERERASFLAAAPSFAIHAARFVSSTRELDPSSSPSSATLADPGNPRSSTVRPLVQADPIRTAARQSAALVATSFAAMAAAALLVLWFGQPIERTYTKGQPHIGWFVKRGDEVHRGRMDELLHPRDDLRFVYSSDAPRYFALFNLDARAATVYFPVGPSAVRVRAGNDVALDFSVELDDQLGTERVWALFCEQSFELEPLRAALLATGRLPVRAGCLAELVELQKVAPR